MFYENRTKRILKNNYQYYLLLYFYISVFIYFLGKYLYNLHNISIYSNRT